MNKDLEVFVRIPSNVLRPWLEKERADAYKYLAEGTENVVLFRAQGKVQFVEKVIKLLDEAQAR
jgi:hypothetical protein